MWCVSFPETLNPDNFGLVSNDSSCSTPQQIVLLCIYGSSDMGHNIHDCSLCTNLVPDSLKFTNLMMSSPGTMRIILGSLRVSFRPKITELTKHTSPSQVHPVHMCSRIFYNTHTGMGLAVVLLALYV